MVKADGPTSSFQTCAHACSSASPFPPSPSLSLSRYWAVVRFNRMLIVSSSFLYWFIRSEDPRR